MKNPLTTIILLAICMFSANAEATDPAGGGGDKDVIAVVLGKEIKNKEKDGLDGLIFGALLDQYAKDNKIEPTEDEINVFLEKQEETATKSRLEHEQEKSRLEKELESPSLGVEERKAKQSRLESTGNILKIEQEAAEAAKNSAEQLRPLLRDRAIPWVRTWKINQSLFKKYGGRVIFQQAGVEPLDAYRDFLTEQKKKGTFRFMDEAAELSFWKYFTDNSMHTFLGKDEGEKLMEKPFWLMEKPITK